MDTTLALDTDPYGGDAWSFPGRGIYVKTQIDYTTRTPATFWRTNSTFDCERDALPLPLFWASATDARFQAVLHQAGAMVGTLHRAGWVHGAIAGAHLLVQPARRDRIWLIDFEKARPTHSRCRQRTDLARLFRRAPYLQSAHIESFYRGYHSVFPQGSGPTLDTGPRQDRIGSA